MIRAESRGKSAIEKKPNQTKKQNKKQNKATTTGGRLCGKFRWKSLENDSIAAIGRFSIQSIKDAFSEREKANRDFTKENGENKSSAGQLRRQCDQSR